MKKKQQSALLIAAGIFFLLRGFLPRRSNYVPPPPAPTQPNYYDLFKNWAITILEVFGDVKSLWEPGGPFYNKSKAEQEAIRKAQEEWYRKKVDEIIANS